jgi:hypothetical protein
VLKIPDAVRKISMCLHLGEIPGNDNIHILARIVIVNIGWMDAIEWNKIILKLLTLICFMQPNGHSYNLITKIIRLNILVSAVLEAMSFYKNRNKENRRFEHLVHNFGNAVHLDVAVLS